ncbi:McrB family protein [Campylobacter jejuni]|uniref:McrB family protein n=1 Tax=Campylobacter jejuni TaxID=197 RepID=UPI002F96B418
MRLKGELQQCLKQFVEKVEELKKQGITLGSEPGKWKKQIDGLIQDFDYVCSVNFGSGNLSDYPAINFFRKDILHKGYSNGEIPSQQYGMYIWFSYAHKEKTLYLALTASNKYKKTEFDCKALQDLEKYTGGIFDNTNYDYTYNIKNFSIEDFDEYKEELYNKFCSLVDLFNRFPQKDFIKINEEFESNNTQKMLNQNSSLNQILYGPPGTGKTYHTIDKALEIISKEEKIQIPSEDDRINRKKIFDEYVKNGQIVFTTFHQSYGYEEFVEGIKPIIDNDENSQEVKYDVKDGIFKELCDKSLKNYILSMQNENEIDLDKLIFEFANYINQDFLNKGNEFPLENKVSIKKILLNFKDEYRSFSLGGSIKSPQSLTIDIIKRDYLNFKNKKILSFKDIKPKYDSQSDYHGNAIYYFMFYNKLKEFENIQNEKFKIKKEILKSYIIIIDEINRGNVSKIFGELITLIEPSKRIGEKEELKVTLPYSGKEFGVPKNVYIIGTMNTADRSITSLDTALRRRFEFIEMMPDVSKLSMDCEGINLQELLKAINTRIEYLLDREKTIGHAFFISVENLEDLKKVFKNKIIPLLQEYFYNDYALIDAVLNKNGMLEISVENKDYLKNMTEFIESDKIVYKFSDSNNWSKDTFIKIYE